MAQRFQYRLRVIFYATAIAALLCIVLPPMFRAVQRYLAAKSRPPKSPPKIRYEIADDVKRGAPRREETPATIAPRAGNVPTSSTFIQTNIIRVNGKRVDQRDGRMPPPQLENQ